MLTHNDLKQMSDILDQRLDEKLKPIKKDLSYLKKTVNSAIDILNTDDLKIEKRVTRIENHLQLSSKN